MSQETSGFSQHQPKSQSISFPIHGPPKPTPAHLIPNRSPHTYWVFFSMSYQQFRSSCPWLPPRGHFGDLWCLVLTEVGYEG